MIKRLSKVFVSLIEEYLPDPYLFAIALTFIVFILGILMADNTPVEMVNHWGAGFWDLLEFAMQMCLVLITGHVMANTPLFSNILKKVASVPKTAGGAIAFTTLISAIACWVNWGFGLVIGALLAREVAKQVEGVDYRLLIASAYSGFVVWHAGLAGSVPLTIATEGHFMEELMGVIPVAETIFTPYNLIISVIIIITIPFLNKMMLPKEEDRVVVDPEILKKEDEEAEIAATDNSMDTTADRLENSTLISMLLGAMGVVYLIYYFANNGFDLNLNIVNFLFLTVGIILHKTPRRYLKAFDTAVRGCSGIILQFPLYSGIMGMMIGSGLAVMMSEFFVSIATQTTLPFFSFLSAGIVNFFVPSGGGQWAVQAPIMVPAAVDLGIDVSRISMAVAWGDAWTNMIQPFWALPALGIAGLGARDIMGYCIMVLIWTGIIASLGLMLI
ncbi:short-chain fatty acid transporter [Fuchsiella alkaliacetigena]|uniref:short-chain fatty acid transporter n=1 Tax=Fuchsiella alkaliacetigena TaxID=957042 RepID=UPI00200A8C2A|nr:short-chain fatty acid transporter [Fuchsiella alkaliacetigena]MCK8825059.1 short-chain fatty acid transporter [Fuchsiella alkaliacetigena]